MCVLQAVFPLGGLPCFTDNFARKGNFLLREGINGETGKSPAGMHPNDGFSPALRFNADISKSGAESTCTDNGPRGIRDPLAQTGLQPPAPAIPFLSPIAASSPKPTGLGFIPFSFQNSSLHCFLSTIKQVRLHPGTV